MMKRAAFLILLFVSACRLAQGQAPASTPPPDPQLAPLPEKITFTKQFTYVASPAPAENQTPEQKKFQQFMAKYAPPDRIDVAKDGQVRHLSTHTPTAGTTETWQWGAYTFQPVSAPPNTILMSGPGLSTGLPSNETPNSDFREASWVNSKLYVGEVEFGGTKCFLYKDKENRSAWIDETQRFPIAVQTPEYKVFFTYKAPPDHLELPDDYKKQWERTKHAFGGMRSN